MSVRRHLARLGRFVTDWRNGATLLASVLVALLVFLVIDAQQARNDSAEAQKRTSAAATRRIDLLTKTQQGLVGQIARLVETAAKQQAAIAALEEQVRQMGGEPVAGQDDIDGLDRIFPTATPQPSPSPSRSTVGPRPTPTPTRSPTPRPSPSPTCTVQIAGQCIALT